MSLLNQLGGAVKDAIGDDGGQEGSGGLAGGLASMFRSDQTPPFPDLAAQLFSHADGGQKAGLLNTLLSALGPALIPQVLQQFGLGNLAGAAQGEQMTAEQAEAVPPDAVRQIAAQAQQADPSVIERASGFLAEHPELVKGLGGNLLGSFLGR